MRTVNTVEAVEQADPDVAYKEDVEGGLVFHIPETDKEARILWKLHRGVGTRSEINRARGIGIESPNLVSLVWHQSSGGWRENREGLKQLSASEEE